VNDAQHNKLSAWRGQLCFEIYILHSKWDIKLKSIMYAAKPNNISLCMSILSFYHYVVTVTVHHKFSLHC